MKKLLAILLALCMVFTMMPTVARAEEVPGEAETDRIVVPVPEEETDEEIPETGNNRIEIPFQINPLYEGLVNEADLEIPEIPEPDEIVTHAATFQSEENAAKTIRSNMKNRTETYTVYVYSTNSDYNALFLELLNNAVVHTGVGTEGDYLMWHLAGWGGEVEIARSGEGYNYTYTYVTPYYTTADQEKEMTTAVNNLINSLGIKYKSDYEKVCAVYDWICANVTYDHANLEDSSYTLKFSAYAALVNKTAVCQGYALLFYRLMLELGVDTRFIGGDGGGPHAWNIVQLGDYYYTVDATWDAGYTDYEYFLKSTWNFVGHSRDPEFDYWEFHMDHPMAAEDYVHGGTATLDPYISMGYCGTAVNDYLNAIWVMMRDGTLYIEGEGATLNYSADALPYWFYWIDHIEKAEISEGVTKVGDYSFYTATALKEVSLPESLTDMGQYAFAASGLETVEIPASVKKLRNVFENCDALTSVTFHEGLVEIGSSTFEDCDALKNFSFPSTLTTIGYDAFHGCDSITEVTIPETVTTLRDSFSGCTNLVKLTLNNFGKIATYAFTNCVKLTEVIIGPNITEIGSEAFSKCTSLKEITIPSNIENIFANAFKNCTALEIAYISNTGAIDQSTFAGCTKLNQVYLANVQSINQRAFENCNLQSITIPASVQGIGTYAFLYNYNLSEIHFEGDAPHFNANTFYSITATAYYPANNPTWTEDVRQNYGGTITWVSYAPPCTDHTYESVVTAPTCSEQGYTTYVCSRCGDSYVGDYTDPVDHSYEDGTCIWCGDETYTAEWKSATTSLNGTIDLNIYVVLSENLMDEEDAFIRFSYGNKVVDVPIAEGVESVSDGVLRYRYSCPMYAKEVSEIVTVQVMKGDEAIGSALEYSIVTYCMNRINKSTNPAQVALCKALLNYAAAAQISLNYNTENLANAQLAEADKILPDGIDVSGYAASNVGSETGIKTKSATLMLESEVSVRVYFTLEEGYDISDFTFTIDGKVVEPQKNSTGWFIETDGIAAKNLDQMLEFSVGGITVTYGPMSYVNSKLSNSKTNADTLNLVKALYAYWQAAEALLG